MSASAEIDCTAPPCRRAANVDVRYLMYSLSSLLRIDGTGVMMYVDMRVSSSRSCEGRPRSGDLG